MPRYVPGQELSRAVRAFVLILAACATSAPAQDARRGEYLARLGGCIACHTEESKGASPFAGGRPLKTPFGTFYGPNITPDPRSGIGRWTEADFVRAMRFGLRPDGSHYFPAFPYPSFTNIGDRDLSDLWSYLRTLPANQRPNQSHQLRFPFGTRALVAAWNLLYFKPGPFRADPKTSAQVNLGTYIVQSLGHCSECHTPRNSLGGPNMSRFLGGGKLPDGKDTPNITPTRLKNWSDAEIKELFSSGMTPDGDMVSSSMAEVVEDTTSRMSPKDLDAVVAYLRTLPAVPDEKKQP